MARFQPEWRLARSRRWQAQSGLFQPWPFTRPNRHPDFFDVVASRLADAEDLRILSFGCATGEEAFALASRLPRARIDGIDINLACIKKARRRMPSALKRRVHFAQGDSVPDTPHRYDAILCLSVLRHARLDAERPESCADILPFSRYLAMIESFDRALKPGGLLLLWGANFLFTDTPVAARYQHIPVEGREGKCGAIYGPDNRLRDMDHHRLWVFEKLAAAD
jgi:2-polyprenyl-3-methyl-5-hydroxy-6-metoxy-1,4-benzoquinol methylase